MADKGRDEDRDKDRNEDQDEDGDDSDEDGDDSAEDREVVVDKSRYENPTGHKYVLSSQKQFTFCCFCHGFIW